MPVTRELSMNASLRPCPGRLSGPLAWNLHKFWAIWTPHEPHQSRHPHAPITDLSGRDRQHHRDRATAGPDPAGDHPAIAAAGGADRQAIIRARRPPADAD